MTFRKKLFDFLVSGGFFEADAYTVLDAFQHHEMNESMKGRWEHPAAMFTMLQVALRPFTLAWIDANAPKAWFRELWVEQPKPTRTVEEVLRRDPLKDLSVETGVSYKELPDLQVLGYAIRANKEKAAVLEAADDTHYGIKFDETLRIAKELGYEVKYEELMPGYEVRADWKIDPSRFVIMQHTTAPLLLMLEEYQGTTNSAKVYGFMTGDIDYKVLEGCSHGCDNYREMYPSGKEEEGVPAAVPMIQHWDKDVRDGLRFTTNRMLTEAALIPPSPGCRSIGAWWFTRHPDSRGQHPRDEAETKANTLARIARLPEDLKTFWNIKATW